MYKIMGTVFKGEKAIEEIYSKNFKRYYNGKPTKRYVRLNNRLNKSDNLPHDTIQKLLHGIY